MKKCFNSKPFLAPLLFVLYAFMAAGSTDDIFGGLYSICILLLTVIFIIILIRMSNSKEAFQRRKQFESEEKEFDVSDHTSTTRCAMYYYKEKNAVMLVSLSTNPAKKEVINDFCKDACAIFDNYICAVCAAKRKALLVDSRKDIISWKIIDYADPDSVDDTLSNPLPPLVGKGFNTGEHKPLFVIVEESYGTISVITPANHKSFSYQTREEAAKKTASTVALRAIGAYVFVLDDASQTLAIINNNGHHRLLHYSDILKVSYAENGQTIMSRSTGRTLGGAAVGGMLFGGAGAVVGGMSGNVKQQRKITSMDIRIVTRNTSKPTIILPVKLSSDAHAIENENLYNSRKEWATEIQELISLVIDKADSAAHQPAATASPAPQPQSANMSIADELLKLSKLKDQGAISEEEYNALKKKHIGL